MERIIFLNNDFHPGMVGSIVRQIEAFDMHGHEPVFLYIESYGGCVDSMMAIVDAMERAKSPIATVAVGIAASSGFFTLAAGEKGMRYAFPNARIMMHGMQISGKSDSKHVSKLEDMQDLAFKLCNKHVKLSEAQFEELMERDSYIGAEEAIELGIIDQIIS